ncbi:MAG TPA: oligosaccharide flippase family protein [Rhizomicrobium sp.]|jgi:PST family polysaccharide transporter|nr:oligosaccharide flippase family protein [Rhizomicrobium sp.]
MDNRSQPHSAQSTTSKADLRAGISGRVVFGTVLLSTASITKLALQCVLIPVLARVLGPGIFGEMSIAMSFVLLANMLSDGGMGAALTREHHADRELESTVYWLSTSIGIALALTICFLAWPVACLYGERSLFPVLLALAPILVVSSSLSVANARIIRRQRFEIFAAGDVVCAILSAAAGLALALYGLGIWSLVVQQLIFWATKGVWLTCVAGFHPAFALHMRLARPLLRFSANNLAANVAEFAGRSAPVLIVGGILGVSAAARFAMAYQLTRVADMVASDPVNLATFSAISATRDRHEAANFTMAALRILTLLLVPLFCGFALTADLLTHVVLGQRWIGTGPALAALAPGALLLCLYRFVAAVLLGTGRSSRTFKLTLMTGVTTAAGTVIGAHFGVTWAVAGFSLGACVLAPLYLWSLVRPMHLSIACLVSSARTSLIATAGMACAVLLIRGETSQLDAIAQLLACTSAGVLVFAIAALAFGRNQIRRDIETLRRKPRTEPAPEPSAWPFMPTGLDEDPSPITTAA